MAVSTPRPIVPAPRLTAARAALALVCALLIRDAGLAGAGPEGKPERPPESTPAPDAKTPLHATPPAAPTPPADNQPMTFDGDTIYGMGRRDVIPPIDDGQLVPVAEAAFMSDGEAVLGFERQGVARAYPLAILEKHEVVNDKLGDVPIVITWCSLVSTGAAYVRSVPSRELSFGLSGALWRDNLVLYDRQTGSLWSQALGKAIHGQLGGKQLELIPTTLTDWGHWRQAYPDTLVLVKEPNLTVDAFNRRYVKNPEQLGLTGTKNPDPRMPGKARILGLPPGRLGNTRGIAYAMDRFSLLEDVVEGNPVLVTRDSGVPGGRIFRRVVGDQELHFKLVPESDRATDSETGGEWDLVSGRALTGPLAGRRLEAVQTVTSYWFAWIKFNPGSELRPASETP